MRRLVLQAEVLLQEDTLLSIVHDSILLKVLENLCYLHLGALRNLEIFIVLAYCSLLARGKDYVRVLLAVANTDLLIASGLLVSCVLLVYS